MQSLITKIITEKLSTYAAIISIFTFTILLDRDFACTCKPQVPACILYMYLPPVIIFVLMLLLDSSFQRVCRYYSSHCKCLCGLCCFYVNHFLGALLVGSLWVAFLFLDGDWYVCCLNNGSEEQAQLACKAEKNIKDNEKALKAELKNTSRVIGGCILFGVVLVAFVLPLCVRSKCWWKKIFLYHKLIIIEEGNVMKTLLRNSAKERLTEVMTSKINQNEHERCFDVARELIENDPSSTTAEPGRKEKSNKGFLLDDVETETEISGSVQYVPLDSYPTPADNLGSTA